MRLFASLVSLVNLVSLAVAAPGTNFHDIIYDINTLHRSAADLGNHIHSLDIMVRAFIFLSIPRGLMESRA